MTSIFDAPLPNAKSDAGEIADFLTRQGVTPLQILRAAVVAAEGDEKPVLATIWRIEYHRSQMAVAHIGEDDCTGNDVTAGWLEEAVVKFGDDAETYAKKVNDELSSYWGLQ